MAAAQQPLVVTCEHASASVPAWAQALLRAHLSPTARRAWARALHSHRGIDLGAAALATHIARAAQVPCLLGRATRLLVDLNRSAHHPALFSEFARALPAEARARLRTQLWWPHWRAVAVALRRARLAYKAPVFHVAAHSFDPRLAFGRERIDVGLLYDPTRPLERAWVCALRAALHARAPALRVRRNAPYRGIADGLPTALRRRLGPGDYAGIEIEVNQFLTCTAGWTQIRSQLAASIVQAVRSVGRGPDLR